MQEEPFPSRKKYYLWVYKGTCFKSCQCATYFFKPVGMAGEEINNAFLSMSSFKLLSVAMRLLRLDTESVGELERQIAVFGIIGLALTVLPRHIVGISRIPHQPSSFLIFCFMRLTAKLAGFDVISHL